MVILAKTYYKINKKYRKNIFNSIRKEIGFLKGDLRICSLNAELLNYFRQNRLDRIFHIYKNEVMESAFSEASHRDPVQERIGLLW